MKYKTTDKAIRAGYGTTIRIGYCNAQNLLRLENPIAYNSNREGWKYDVYAFGNVAIITGYSPIGKIAPEYDTIRAYDKKARDILDNYGLTYEQQREQINGLIRAFIAEVTGEEAA